MILTYFETDRGKGTCDGLEDFLRLELVDGREQEYLDRSDRILRDLGPDALECKDPQASIPYGNGSIDFDERSQR